VFVLLNHLRRLRSANASPQPSVRGSLAVRHLDAGSCNGCEHELTAAANPFYDLQQYGLNIVASPRHADVLLITGAITTRMLPALKAAYDAMPEPRLVAALGDCALACNLLGQHADLAGPLEDIVPVALRIPGCPPAPAAIVAALTAALREMAAGSDVKALARPNTDGAGVS
jgi:Ni,Fe-hydrogenase III small subunit